MSYLDEYGHSGPQGKLICAGCFDDYAIIDFIRTNGQVDKCSYCGRRRKVLDASEVFDFIIDGVCSEWDHPVNCAGWNSREGGWLGVDVIDSWELMNEISLEANEQFIDDFIDCVSD